MSHKKKYQIISPAQEYDELNFDDIYNSKSFLIKFYAYLPFVHTLKEINFSEQSLFLDLGCAEGPFLPTLNCYTKRTVALDIDYESIKISKKIVRNQKHQLSKVDLLHSDGLYLPFKDETFDIIICLEVLEHVKNTKKAVNEIHRVLNKNGVLVCSLPIEIGLSLLIRNLLGKFLKFSRPFYSRKEMFRSAILKKPCARTEFMDHKNFDWRIVKKEIKKTFKKTKVRFTPINFLKNCNPIVIIKAFK